MACLFRRMAWSPRFSRAAKPIDSSAALGYHCGMFRILLFLLSLLVTAGGFAQAVVDGTISIGADKIVLTSFVVLWALGFVFYMMSSKRPAPIGTSNRDR